MANPQLGVDIGNRSIHIVVWDGKHIRKAISEPMPEGLIRDGRILSQAAMAEFLKNTKRTHHISGGMVSLALHTGECFCRRFDVPTMTHAQMKVNLSYEFRDFITQEKDKYFYDYAVLDTLEEEGKLDVLAAAVTKETIANYDSLFHRVGMKLRVGIPEEMAYLNLLRRFPSEAATKGSICILDLGHAAVSLHMIRNGQHQSGRNLDYGCSALDDVIADHFHVAAHVACGYRETNYENCQDLDACRDIYGRIALEVLKAINYYNYSNAEQPVEWICCWGGGLKMEPLMETLRGTLSVPVEGWEKLLPDLGQDPVSLLALGAALQKE